MGLKIASESEGRDSFGAWFPIPDGPKSFLFASPLSGRHYWNYLQLEGDDRRQMRRNRMLSQQPTTSTASSPCG